MDFISNRDPQIEMMLKAIGLKSMEDLFESIPSALKIRPPLHEDGLSEYEGMCLMEKLAKKNVFPSFENYLGAGAYEHHIPALVQPICSKSEFLTSYTPYQAEASQGMLQVIFEFQSAICALTGMFAANASVYDGASACAEALLMALRHKRPRQKLWIANSLHPHYRGVVNSYLSRYQCPVKELPVEESGTIDAKKIEQLLDNQTAAVLVQSPNFFGCIEPIQAIAEKARQVGAVMILCANPLAYGLYASAAEMGVDIAVGDCQPFGLSLEFGGPYLGYMACRKELIRQLPGRIVGETTDVHGKKGFVLTHQAREQHIRREKATSNMCTNQALGSLASLIAMLWYGKEGLPALALTNYQRAAYLRNQLSMIPGLYVDEHVPIFNEFVVTFPIPIVKVQEHFRSRGIEPGLCLKRYFPEMERHLLVAVTETKSKAQLDRYVAIATELEKV